MALLAGNGEPGWLLGWRGEEWYPEGGTEVLNGYSFPNGCMEQNWPW